MEFNIGDIITGINNTYGITNKYALMVVTDIYENNNIRVQVLASRRSSDVGCSYDVNPNRFRLTTIEEFYEEHPTYEPIRESDIQKFEIGTSKKKIRRKKEDVPMFKIKDYKVDKKKQTVVIFFEDGDTQKAKCCDGDTFDLERGIEVCVMKHICKGTDAYHKVLKTANEQIVAVDKAKIEAEKRAEIKARQKVKRAEKRKARAERKRAERIAEMREAYVAALKEYNGDIDKAVEAVESGN